MTWLQSRNHRLFIAWALMAWVATARAAQNFAQDLQGYDYQGLGYGIVSSELQYYELQQLCPL